MCSLFLSPQTTSIAWLHKCKFAFDTTQQFASANNDNQKESRGTLCFPLFIEESTLFA